MATCKNCKRGGLTTGTLLCPYCGYDQGEPVTHGRVMGWMTMGLIVLGITAITLIAAVYPDLLAALFFGAIVIVCIGIGFMYPLPRDSRLRTASGLMPSAAAASGTANRSISGDMSLLDCAISAA
jgi:hypothetical protein